MLKKCKKNVVIRYDNKNLNTIGENRKYSFINLLLKIIVIQSVITGNQLMHW